MKISALLFCGLALLAQASLANPDPAGAIAVPAPVPITPPVIETSDLAVATSLRPKARKKIVVPKARWDNIKGSRSWSLAVLQGLRAQADMLPDLVPRDIADYCPAYPSAGRAQREAFWVGLISALAWHESTHRPGAVGGGGRWYGLVQIYPPTARFYQCKARNGAALKDPEDNLSCALRIMAVTVPRDKVISKGMRGVAADWGPFHSRRKREDIMQWTRSQKYCTGLARSLRPVLRPTDLGPDAEKTAAPLSEG
ncbi:transglycosylase SLT domain-containing protein [Mameliella alba]|nr:transglycosylase SLT domain-containing protein [Mameliella sediminis]MBY6160854.1 transglycosylase SLT domain-containing protein [Mameliella alba]MBY6169324.1 transglycosylase SLT domain-containing protein [Mameliella alba]MBY6174343.1 transglycosylase SLT domain-containing protein [Mameliella alba]